MFEQRLARVRSAMTDAGVEVVLLSVGPDLPWLIGYEAMPLERLTMLVVPADAEATLVVPFLEAPRVTERPDVFAIRSWHETEDPIDIVAGLVGRRAHAAIGNRTWTQFLVDLQGRLPNATFSKAGAIVGPLRAVKTPDEVDSLRAAAAAADRVAAQLQGGDIPLIGRTEAEISADIGRRLLAEGHDRVNFAIVAAGPNAASPHHDAGPRVIEAGEVVLCDFGGTMTNADGVGYCSDITRCVHTGEPSAEFAELYAVLHAAQQAAVAAATVGTTCEAVDAVARDAIAAAGYGDHFIHRTGHGIGVEEHEDPYIVSGNGTPLEPGHAFSIEPGIYLPKQFGARLEDIVVATESGPDPLNHADHALVVLSSRFGVLFAVHGPRWCTQNASVWGRDAGDSYRGSVISLDGASFLLQWATGGLLFLWVTTRRREVGLGYGWLMRGTYAIFAALAFVVGVFVIEPSVVRDLSSLGVALAATAVLGVSVKRKGAGVSGQRALAESRTARVAAMTGIDRQPEEKGDGPEFPPALDLIAPAIGTIGIIAAAVAATAATAGGSTWLAVARFLVGAAFLGAVTDAMLLGHWYLVQPGLARAPLNELVRWTGYLAVPEIVLLLVPTGMISVINGTIDDSYNGLLGWFWLACAVTTIGLVIVTRLALKERQYSAVMAATGLLYLAILTAFGTDLVARALLRG